MDDRVMTMKEMNWHMRNEVKVKDGGDSGMRGMNRIFSEYSPHVISAVAMDPRFVIASQLLPV